MVKEIKQGGEPMNVRNVLVIKPVEEKRRRES
jgi:hypothetical protein